MYISQQLQVVAAIIILILQIRTLRLERWSDIRLSPELKLKCPTSKLGLLMTTPYSKVTKANKLQINFSK